LILAHSTHTWLPLTEKWIFGQVENIRDLKQIVLCDKKDVRFEELATTFYNPNSGASIKSRIRNKMGLPDLFRQQILADYDDVILFSHYGIQGYHDLRLKKQRHITRFYGYDLTRTVAADKRWKNRYKKLFDDCDTFIVEGKHMKETLLEMGCDANKVEINFLGTNVEDITFYPRQEANTLHVLIACATAERKGIIYALEALHTAIKKYKIPIHIHWVGGRNSNYIEYIRYENQLNDYITSSKLQPFITNYGFLSPEKLQTVAALCHVGIHPSVWAADGDCEGGYPVVLLDLMASGLPIITTTHCDIPEVVNIDNGYLSPEKNSDHLASALVDCYNTKSYIQKSLSARHTIEEKFDSVLLGESLRKIILR